MDLFWALLIIASLVILLFAIIPSFVAPAQAHRPPPVAPPPLHAPASRRNDEQDRQMLDAHYLEARDEIPENYPRKKIGACPYSKPPSTDLPLRNVPMCVARTSANMKLPYCEQV